MVKTLYFNITAAGNLLMLAPIAWPYLPGEKKMTRIDACILNRIAQWLSGDGAVEIKYRGVEPAEIDRLAAEAIERGSGFVVRDSWLVVRDSWLVARGRGWG